MLDWAPEIPLEKGLRHTIKYFKDLEKKYNLEVSKERIVTSEELKQALIKAKARGMIQTLVTNPKNILKPDVVGTTIDISSEFIDWYYAKTCETLPGAIGLKYREIGFVHYVSDCKFSYEDNLPMFETVLDVPTQGSLEKFRKANIGAVNVYSPFGK